MALVVAADLEAAVVELEVAADLEVAEVDI